MKQIDTLFDRMDAWRHFPNYQLERRADIFFALYLPEGLGARVLGARVRSSLSHFFFDLLLNSLLCRPVAISAITLRHEGKQVLVNIPPVLI